MKPCQSAIISALVLISTACGPDYADDGQAEGSSAAGTGGGSSGSSTWSASGEGASSDSTTESEPCSEVFEGDLVICGENREDCGSDPVLDTEIGELARVGVVTGNLYIIGTTLSDVGGLACLTGVHGEYGIKVRENPDLVSLAGLERLEKVAGMSFSYNSRLGSLSGLASLREIGYVGLYGNDSLSAIELDSVERLDNLYLGTYPDIACPQGEFIDQGYEYDDNPSLTSLDGLDALESLGYLTVSGQSGLVSIDALVALAEAGTQFGQTDFTLNDKLDVSEIETFVAAAGSFGNVCGNLGDPNRCACAGPD